MTAANATAPETAAAEEKQTNCLACNKPLRKIKIYYRNGKLYCDKKCWKKAKSGQTAEGKK